MPCVVFEPTIPASERAKTVHALDRAATEIGLAVILSIEIFISEGRKSGESCTANYTLTERRRWGGGVECAR
jgi:hypothetical protein